MSSIDAQCAEFEDAIQLADRVFGRRLTPAAIESLLSLVYDMEAAGATFVSITNGIDSIMDDRVYVSWRSVLDPSRRTSAQVRQDGRMHRREYFATSHIGSPLATLFPGVFDRLRSRIRESGELSFYILRVESHHPDGLMEETE